MKKESEKLYTHTHIYIGMTESLFRASETNTTL